MTNDITPSTNYEVSKLNSLKHGILSQYAVMPWENAGEYESLLQSLVAEYKPIDATEEHLIEELAGVMWRKRRLRYAEQTELQERLRSEIHNNSFNDTHHSATAALLQRGKEVEGFDIPKAMTASPEETAQEIKEYKGFIKDCRKVVGIIDKTNDYSKALKALSEEDRETWLDEYLGERIHEFGNDVFEETPEDLRIHLEQNITHYEKQIYELESREKIKRQIYGQAFLTEHKLEKFTRYETHLDRKMERILSTLFKLRELKP